MAKEQRQKGEEKRAVSQVSKTAYKNLWLLLQQKKKKEKDNDDDDYNSDDDEQATIDDIYDGARSSRSTSATAMEMGSISGLEMGVSEGRLLGKSPPENKYGSFDEAEVKRLTRARATSTTRLSFSELEPLLSELTHSCPIAEDMDALELKQHKRIWRTMGLPWCPDHKNQQLRAQFYLRIVRELDKVDEFCKAMEEQLRNTVISLEVQWANLEEDSEGKTRDKYLKTLKDRTRSSIEDSTANNVKAEKKAEEDKDQQVHRDHAGRSIEKQFIFVYRKINMLLNYTALNYNGFDKIIKTFDKHAKTKCRKEFRASLNSRNFVSSSGPNDLLQMVEEKFANNFEHGDKAKAEVRLLTKMTRSQFGPQDMFRYGLKVGIAATLFGITIFSTMLHSESEYDVLYHSGFFAVYRGLGCLVTFIWMYGFNVYIWQKNRINFVYIMELNPRNRLSDHQVLEEAANISIFYLSNLLLFYCHVMDLGPWTLSHSKNLYPLSLLLYFFYRMFAPMSSLWTTRRWILTCVWHVITAPFGRIRFCDSYVADIITSMVKILNDLTYAICYYGTFHDKQWCSSHGWIFMTVCSTMPLWWRFAQNIRQYFDTSKRWPYGGNALKYALSQMVVVAGIFHPFYHQEFFTSSWYGARVFWIICVVLSAGYSFYWDVVHDYGLWTNEGWMKRKLLYPQQWWYYTAATIDFFLRFSWTLTITPVDPYLSTHYMPFVIIAELFRRFLWSIFRVEYEQVKKGGQPTVKDDDKARKQKKLHFVPMYFDTQELKKERQKNYNNAILREVAIMIFLLFFTTILVAIMP